jgi:hypothetical protein
MSSHCDLEIVRSDLIDLVKFHVYRGDFDRPLPKPDAAGFYHYRDNKLHVELSISPRDGWLSCSLNVYIIRGRWPFRKEDLVLSTGYGYDVRVFRPGMWCSYVGSLAKKVRHNQAEQARRAHYESSQMNGQAEFTPIDDSDIFSK